jgi:predicted DCC family thiol-disulfide oxidoreductase YuxK
LYYDGQCPLCTAEINHLRRLKGDELDLIDVHGCGQQGLPSRREMLEKLHYRDADGRLLVGLDANIAAWQHTRIGFLWRILDWPLIRPLAEWAYNRWAVIRYRRLYGD